jgi:hypothetical protein
MRLGARLEKNRSSMSIPKNLVRRFDVGPVKASSNRRQAMRVMVIVKATEDSESGAAPDPKGFEVMGKFNEELVNAGLVLAADGLTPSSKGKRVQFDGESRTVIDGPFAEARELIAGFWIWEVKDMDEAIAWAKRCPNCWGRGELEIRPLFDMAKFAEEKLTPEFRERRERVREKLSGKLGPGGAFGGLGT